MVLAAGLGTRLRPLTDSLPKPLVEIAGRTLLEITLARLKSFGITDVIINVHHFADMIVEYLKSHDSFGMHIEISQEEELLDTGGGLKKAGWFFLEPDSETPFILHNVDVLTNIDLNRMVEFHKQQKALATLAVQKRETSRYLLFNEWLELCGRRVGIDGKPELVRPCTNPMTLAFSGVHVIAPRLVSLITETGAFSVINSYLRLAKQGESVVAFRADQYHWRDLGKLESLELAEQDLARHNSGLM